ncbi:type II toxin-antitoxin system PemK/MazF family toxin [Brevibacterium siliguriense]|nr:type II toxin-antitoxin system PemK/MazF family toxin [Brevibacterium siliguriense]
MLRGEVWRATVSEAGPKLWVVVSHNARNRGFDSVLAVRVTTTNKNAQLPTAFEVPPNECIHGWIMCDTLTEIWEDDLVEQSAVGAVSSAVMKPLESHLLAALGY